MSFPSFYTKGGTLHTLFCKFSKVLRKPVLPVEITLLWWREKWGLDVTVQ